MPVVEGARIEGDVVDPAACRGDEMDWGDIYGGYVYSRYLGSVSPRVTGGPLRGRRRRRIREGYRTIQASWSGECANQ